MNHRPQIHFLPVKTISVVIIFLLIAKLAGIIQAGFKNKNRVSSCNKNEVVNTDSIESVKSFDEAYANCFVLTFFRTNLPYANLTEANLRRAIFVETNIENAISDRYKIYGLAA